MNQDLDHTLLQRFQQKDDQEAFGQLVERYAPVVHGAAQRRMGSEDLARDVTQNVFIALAKKAKKIKARTPLIAWLHEVTRTTSIDLIRAEARRKEREQKYHMEQNLSNQPLEDCWNEISPILDASLDELNEADRNALLLRYFEQSSLKFVGNSLGVGEDAARKRVSRAIEKLRQILAKKGITTSAATLMMTVESNAAPTLQTSFLSTLKASSIPAGTATTLTIQTILMTTKAKLITGGLALVGVTAFTTHEFFNDANPAADSAPQVEVANSLGSRTNSDQSSEEDADGQVQTQAQPQAESTSELYLTPESLAQAKMMFSMLASISPEQRSTLSSPSGSFDPYRKSYKLPNPVADALAEGLAKLQEKRQAVTTSDINSILSDKKFAEELMALSSMESHEDYSPAHKARQAELNSILDQKMQESLQKIEIGEEDINALYGPWFKHNELINNAKSTLNEDESEILDKFINQQKELNREQKAFNRSQQLAKDLNLDLEQREALYESLYEHESEQKKNIAKILRPEQIESYNTLPKEAPPENGRISFSFHSSTRSPE